MTDGSARGRYQDIRIDSHTEPSWEDKLEIVLEIYLNVHHWCCHFFARCWCALIALGWLGFFIFMELEYLSYELYDSIVFDNSMN
jgi:hypothetical protein